MTGSSASGHPTSRFYRRAGFFLLASMVVHGIALLWLGHRPTRNARQASGPIELFTLEPKPPPVQQPPKPIKQRKTPIQVAPVAKAPPRPKEPAPPPPPNQATPPGPPKKAPLVVGLSMSSTTEAGSYSAAVGNTVYGKTDTTAVDPSQVNAYRAPKYAPIYQVDAPPQVASEFKIPYPPEAKRLAIEGTVTLSILIDDTGNVLDAKVLSGPGHGLNEAALSAIKRFKFKPATKAGQPVSTEMKYAYTFLLE